MTQDEIREIAKESGMLRTTIAYDAWVPDHIEEFVKLIEQSAATKATASEREACAVIADGWPDYNVQGLAEAIRARGQE